MPSRRRKYAKEESVVTAGDAAYDAVKDTWANKANPTPEEEVAAKNARLKAKIDAAQALVDAE